MSSIKMQLPSKLVYIHELDSVRNSEAEVQRAKKSLYEEIIINGNTPVISFNQLADSKAFLGLITDTSEALDAEDGDNEDFSDIGHLMKRGRIKIARFLINVPHRNTCKIISRRKRHWGRASSCYPDGRSRKAWT